MSKARSKPAVKQLAQFAADNSQVRCWFDIREREVCFRRKRSRRVYRIAVRELHAKLTGQILMPFV